MTVISIHYSCPASPADRPMSICTSFRPSCSIIVHIWYLSWFRDIIFVHLKFYLLYFREKHLYDRPLPSHKHRPLSSFLFRSVTLASHTCSVVRISRFFVLFCFVSVCFCITFVWNTIHIYPLGLMIFKLESFKARKFFKMKTLGRLITKWGPV